VHKTLALVEYLLKHGSLGVIDDAAAHSITFAALSRFSAPRPPVGATRLTAEERAEDEGCSLVRTKARLSDARLTRFAADVSSRTAQAKALLGLLDDVEALARCRTDARRSAGRFVGMGSESFRRRAFGSLDGGSSSSVSVSISSAGGDSSVSSAFGSPVQTSTAGSPRQATTPAGSRTLSGGVAQSAARGVRPFSLGGGTPGASRSLDEMLAAHRSNSIGGASSAAMEEYAAEAASLRASTGRASSGDSGGYRPPQARPARSTMLLRSGADVLPRVHLADRGCIIPHQASRRARHCAAGAVSLRRRCAGALQGRRRRRRCASDHARPSGPGVRQSLLYLLGAAFSAPGGQHRGRITASQERGPLRGAAGRRGRPHQRRKRRAR
jgi:hypothetical protein